MTELVCGIRGVVGTMNEDEIVSKIMISLTPSDDNKVFVIEEIITVSMVTRDSLVGKLFSFEMTRFFDNTPKYESSFKDTISKDKQKYDSCESYSSSSKYGSRYVKDLQEIQEEERKMEDLESLISKRVSKGVGKYEGKFPLKCFNAIRLVPKHKHRNFKPKYNKKCYYDSEGVIDE